jgi:hypothetical protein
MVQQGIVNENTKLERKIKNRDSHGVGGDEDKEIKQTVDL